MRAWAGSLELAVVAALGRADSLPDAALVQLDEVVVYP